LLISSPRAKNVSGIVRPLHAEGVLAPRNPIVGSLPACCARAASGHAAAPPSAASFALPLRICRTFSERKRKEKRKKSRFISLKMFFFFFPKLVPQA
jgi:hypothetical protein